MPCAAHLNGQYGVKGVYVGVPVVIGEKGVERIVEIKLNKDEKAAFNKSVSAVRGLIKVILQLKHKVAKNTLSVKVSDRTKLGVNNLVVKKTPIKKKTAIKKVSVEKVLIKKSRKVKA